MIYSLLDTDWYKFKMQQVMVHQFPDVRAQFEFKCRNIDINLNPFANEIMKEIQALGDLRIKDDELEFIAKQPEIHSSYIDFLRGFRLNPKIIKVAHDVDNKFFIWGEASWFQISMFETFILSIVEEVYCKYAIDDTMITSARKRLDQKIMLAKQEIKYLKFADFGTRRRSSGWWQETVLKMLNTNLSNTCFLGTSNVLYSKMLDKKPIGSMAHEFFQAMQALVNIKDSQKFALESWIKEYRGQAGIVLSDIVGFDAFLRDFDLYFCKVFDGARHDSGDPYVWCDKLISHYIKMGIDPLTKIALFSDGLTIDKAINLTLTFKNKINVVHGIGTHLTNDYEGFKPLNIVMKMVKCNNMDVCKISDSPGKCMCNNKQYLNYLKSIFNCN